MTQNKYGLKQMTLIYSPDDEEESGKGYYWERFSDWKISQLYKTKHEAIQARHNHRLKFKEV